ncbi:hypothetical protein Agub_g2629, partial [Astrephomene gubernaculifera]
EDYRRSGQARAGGSRLAAAIPLPPTRGTSSSSSAVQGGSTVAAATAAAAAGCLQPLACAGTAAPPQGAHAGAAATTDAAAAGGTATTTSNNNTRNTSSSCCLGAQRPTGQLPWWLPTFQHRLQRWFGLESFLLLRPASFSRRILDETEATTLLGAASLALAAAAAG